MSFVTLSIFGVLSASFALLLEIALLGSTDLSSPIVSFFSIKTVLILLFAAVIEEVSKYLFLVQYKRRFFPSLTLSLGESALIGTLFGGSFSLLEIFLSLEVFTLVHLFPILSVVILHIATSVLLSLFVFSREIRLSQWGTLAAVIAVHLGYNLAISFAF